MAPDSFSKLECDPGPDQVRRCLLKRFPYMSVFLCRPDEVLVVAVCHVRSPTFLLARPNLILTLDRRIAMSVPKVAIIGRPNVGKSSLFNWLSGHLISVVDPTAGVTRDRVEYLLHEHDRYFELVDTGGLGIVDVDNLSEQIEDQIRIAIEQADLLMFVVDGQCGLTPLDIEVAERLRKIDKPKLLVVNKCDSIRTDAEVHEFRRLCEAPLVVTSVKANRNRDELLTAIVEHLPPASDVSRHRRPALAAEPS